MVSLYRKAGKRRSRPDWTDGKRDYTKWFDYDMIVNGLFRNPLEGDYFCMDQNGDIKEEKVVPVLYR